MAYTRIEVVYEQDGKVEPYEVDEAGLIWWQLAKIECDAGRMTFGDSEAMVRTPTTHETGTVNNGYTIRLIRVIGPVTA